MTRLEKCAKVSKLKVLRETLCPLRVESLMTDTLIISSFYSFPCFPLIYTSRVSNLYDTSVNFSRLVLKKVGFSVVFRSPLIRGRRYLSKTTTSLVSLSRCQETQILGYWIFSSYWILIPPLIKIRFLLFIFFTKLVYIF